MCFAQSHWAPSWCRPAPMPLHRLRFTHRTVLRYLVVSLVLLHGFFSAPYLCPLPALVYHHETSNLNIFGRMHDLPWLHSLHVLIFFPVAGGFYVLGCMHAAPCRAYPRSQRLSGIARSDNSTPLPRHQASVLWDLFSRCCLYLAVRSVATASTDTTPIYMYF
jgi:hypothetical protein